MTKLEARLLEAEEMLVAKLAADQRAADLRALAGRFEAWRQAWAAIEPGARRLRSSRDAAASPQVVPQLLDFFEWSMDCFRSMENDAVKLGRAVEHDRHIIGRLVDDLLENSKQLLLLPLAALAAPLAKLVRDLCRDQGKQVDLIVRGDDIEIDKRILEEIKDPLIHLLRNGVDHGIEPPDQRARRGKPPRGTITLAATQVNGNKVQLLVSDDGAGIDTATVKGAAIRRGLISAEDAAALGEPDAQELIFQSEVSTSPIITQVSGRGLGLAIVREKAEKLGGWVSVESRLGAGTTFRIVIPATQATFRGVLVEAGGRQFVLPTTQIARVARARAADVESVEGRECLSLEGRAVPLVRLADVLELPQRESEDVPPGGAPVVVLGAGDQRVAFAVDAVADELEVLVRPLPRPLLRVRNVAAATVLGSGQVAPILNVADLLKSARKTVDAARVVPKARPAEAQAKTILVVEDSITSRMLLKGILESAGYQVTTAVDGIEAFTT
ncbi:MAG: chemotaxis protein CheW, partial [Dongiaceae bacterium]